MAGLTPIKVVGIGRIFNLTDNVELGNQSNFQLTSGVEELTIPNGADWGEGIIPIRQRWSGHFDFREVTPGLVAALVGGTAVTGSNKQVESEEGIIPASTSYIVTLDHTPYAGSATYAAITVIDTAGVVYEQVAPASEVAGAFSHTAGVLTFHEDDKSKTVYVSYWWYDDSAGQIITPTVGSVVGAKEYIFGGMGYSTITGAQKGYVTVYAKKLQLTGELPIGASVGDAGTFGFDFRLNIGVAADLAISFEQK